MKTLTIIKEEILFLITLYLVTSFICETYNPYLWSPGIKILVSFFTLIILEIGIYKLLTKK